MHGKHNDYTTNRPDDDENNDKRLDLVHTYAYMDDISPIYIDARENDSSSYA